MNNYEKIGNLLLEASNNVLKPIFEYELSTYTDSLSCIDFKLGSGKATYHTKKAEIKKTSYYIINYGIKMIELKVSSYESCMLWRSSKEILSRGYFGGILTAKNSIAAVILHEFAHHIQTLKYGFEVSGYNEYGTAIRKVHDDNFYKILDSLYTKNLHNILINYMDKYDYFKNLKFEKESLKQDNFDNYEKKDIVIGDFYKVPSKGDIVHLIAYKKLSKNLELIGVGVSNDIVYRVPYERIIGVSEIKSEKVNMFYKNDVRKGSIVSFKSNGVMKDAEIFYIKGRNISVKCEKGFIYGIYYPLIREVKKY